MKIEIKMKLALFITILTQYFTSHSANENSLKDNTIDDVHTGDIFSLKSSRILKGHTNRIWSVLLLSDQATLVTASADKTIGIWNLTNKIMKKQLLGHKLAVYSLAQLSDKFMASGSGDGTIKIWNLIQLKEYSTLSCHSTAVVALAALNENVLASSSDETIKILNVISGIVLSILENHTNNINSLIFLPEDRNLISASFDKTINVWELEWTSQNYLSSNTESNTYSFDSTVNTLISYNLSQYILGTASGKIYMGDSLETVLCEEISAIFALAVLRTSYLVSGSTNGRLSFWDLKRNGTLIKSFKVDNQFSVLSIAYIQNGTIAVGLSNGILKILELNLPDDYFSSPTTTHRPTTVSPTENQTISADPSFVTIFDYYKHEKTQIYVLKTLNDGKVAVGLNSGNIDIWDTENAQNIKRLPGESRISSIVQLPNGNLASGSVDNQLSIWDVTTSTKLASVSTSLSNDCLTQLSNNLLASFFNQIIRIWRVSNEIVLDKTLLGHQEDIKFIDTLSNGLLVTASNSHFKIWNVTIESTIKSVDLASSINKIVALQNGNLAIALQNSKIMVYSKTNNYGEYFSIQSDSNAHFLDKFQNGNIMAYETSGGFKVYDKNTGSLITEKQPNFSLNVYRIVCLQSNKVAINLYASDIELLGTLNLT